ncbi:hypothetical protein VPH35_132895 [Triticum aestivum]|uniref:J domain-containing protein n=1 Tax=Triticum aestivum TaxID=4565 RepID=A0A3B6SKV1_WHEAT
MAAFAAVTMPLPGRVSGSRWRVVARASATMAAPAGRTHYEVLGVGAWASSGEIKAAYRRLAREVHPDAVGGVDGEGFIRLRAAYATLANPDERALRPGRGWPRRGRLGRRGLRSGRGRGRRISAGRTAGHTHALLSRSPGRRPFGAACKSIQA